MAQKSDASSLLGMVLQFAALGLLFWLRREDYLASIGLNIAGLALGVLALEITRRSLRRLGQQWSLAAQVKQGHRLVTEGPYAWVRHPLYLAFFLLTVGTGLAFCSLPGLLLALPISLSGAGVRIAVEERILRQEFGNEYHRYADSVPSLLPSLATKSSRRMGRRRSR